jgi:glycosyltransferase involved in cell wall biosynthesis
MTKHSLTIGLLSPPWAAVPPVSYGGTETVVSELATGLMAAGHDVLLYATSDSTAAVPMPCDLVASAWDRVGQCDVELPHVMRGYEALAGCDVVHDHTLLGPAWALARGQGNVVTTCHGQLGGILRPIYQRYGKSIPVVAISADQAARAPDVGVDRVIHHGVNPDVFPFGTGAGDYLLFLGRMTADKGVREAVLAARNAGRRLVVAAKSREPAERAYFTEQVAPLLDDDRVYIGEVDQSQKVALLKDAVALLNPITWAEPFGLVMIESLACGTPVVTCPVGAAPEIVDHGVTGFLCGDGGALVDAIAEVDVLNRHACRAAVLERFSTSRMVADHVALYQQVAA